MIPQRLNSKPSMQCKGTMKKEEQQYSHIIKQCGKDFNHKVYCHQ